MVKDLHETLAQEHDIKVDDHLHADHESECGFCGNSFMGSENRIIKNIYGQKWVFCDETCLASFHEKSNYVDEDIDMTTGEEDNTGFEINMKFTGSEHDDDE